MTKLLAAKPNLDDLGLRRQADDPGIILRYEPYHVGFRYL